MMSLTHDGQRVICDGDGCKAEAGVPVALRPRLSRDMPPATPINGWLFLADRSGCRHFCPRCLHQALGRLTGLPGEPEEQP